MVGDGEPDLLAAKSVSMRTIACMYGYGDPARLSELGADVYWHRFGG
jgi:phosphoglycolate phosphatase-like HAD superfamily hydrolase